ncbi:hypothetical protein B0O99DRAFT_732981 [Bisporella sp. PMI_857]|nr:hypothetical protein B0O99DRAFT_732981 [Bisporella sp. PMI_857]
MTTDLSKDLSKTIRHYESLEVPLQFRGASGTLLSHTAGFYSTYVAKYETQNSDMQQSMACWPNGKASDYESGDCRFDPCAGQ